MGDSGENMAEAIMEFIREYGIASKVGYFMMDNATNMNTMIDKSPTTWNTSSMFSTTLFLTDFAVLATSLIWQ
jgi:hypothetical protein